MVSGHWSVQMEQQQATPQTLREIAAEAFVTYFTVRKWFRTAGVGMKPSIAERIRRAVERRGIALPVKEVA